LEIRNNNDITKEEGWMNSVLFAGPAFHVSVGKFFTNITALPQFVNLHKTDAAPGNRDLNHFDLSYAVITRNGARNSVEHNEWFSMCLKDCASRDRLNKKVAARQPFHI
jgi:hypothetical protein